MTNTALVPQEARFELAPGVAVGFTDARTLATDLMKSATLPKWVEGPGDVLAAMLTAAAMKLPLMTVINGSHMIEGKLGPSPQLMHAAVQASGTLEHFEVVESTDKACTIKAKRTGRPEVVATFTWEDAKVAELANRAMWKKYPKRMLYHRVLGFILRDNWPDILAGQYTPDELDHRGAPAAMIEEAEFSAPEQEEPEPLCVEADTVAAMLAELQTYHEASDWSEVAHMWETTKRQATALIKLAKEYGDADAYAALRDASKSAATHVNALREAHDVAGEAVPE